MRPNNKKNKIIENLNSNNENKTIVMNEKNKEKLKRGFRNKGKALFILITKH